jgi:hypothetical protein
MTAAEQYAEFGCSADDDGGSVIIQVGNDMVALTPRQAQRFAYHLAHAYVQAAGGLRRSSTGTWSIGGPR